MSLLGVDVGTSGCKAAVFSEEGQMMSLAYEEYDLQRSQTPDWAELDSISVWQAIKRTIRRAVLEHPDPASIKALSVSSMGEAFVPVTRDREILGPSLLNFDVRGEEYLPSLNQLIDNETLYEINGNTLGNHYSLTKLLWLKDHQPRLFDRTDFFLHWSGFTLYMLGAEAVVDYSLANRTLLFDLSRGDWSGELVNRFGIDRSKLPRTAAAGTPIGTLSDKMAEDLGLASGVVLVTGGHDQSVSAVGCGAVKAGQAAYSMGTYACITPVYDAPRDPHRMMAIGLNTEHHAAPGMFVSFIYNLGGALVKWYRDTFAHLEHQLAQREGRDVYTDLFAELTQEPSSVIVLPHFAQTGPPEYISDTRGVMVGLQLDTSRAEVLKGIIEGITYYLKACVQSLPPTGIAIDDYRVVGGGSRSDAWVQTCADILEHSLIRPRTAQAGALGAAITAGFGAGVFASVEEGVDAMVQLDRVFEPDLARSARYQHRFEQYQELSPLLRSYLRDLAVNPV